MSETAPPPAPARPVPGTDLLGATAGVTAGTLASRVTGFVRVLAIGAVLGTTFAGNTYQTSNLVSNLLFELLAAGLLSSVLVPPFVRLIEGGRRDDAEHLAGTVLGVALVVLGVVTAAALLARPWIMRLLTVAVDDPAIRRQEIDLGSFLLVLLLPQVLLYAVGAVASALLHGYRRFSAVAFAPVANNVVVIATMGLFWVVHQAQAGATTRPGLDLSTAEKLVLGIGTSAGVAAMTLVPLVALWRAGVRLRPRVDLHHPALRQLVRDGAWAAALLALTQVVLVTTLVLANRVEGGVVAFHIAFQIFLLPFAVLAHPVSTTLYPRLAAEAVARRWREFGDSLAGGIGVVAFLVLPAAAVTVAVAEPALRVLRLGALDAAGSELVARLLAAYSVGVVGYSLMYLLVRAAYAAGDTRTPTLVTAGVAGGACSLMVAWFGLASGSSRLAAIGYAHSIAYLLGALVLGILVWRRVGEARLGPLARSLACAVGAGVAARVVVEVLPTGSRLAAATAVLLATAAGVALYAAAQWWLRAPEVSWLRSGGRPPARP